jgi:hypothetical protein
VPPRRVACPDSSSYVEASNVSGSCEEIFRLPVRVPPREVSFAASLTLQLRSGCTRHLVCSSKLTSHLDSFVRVSRLDIGRGRHWTAALHSGRVHLSAARSLNKLLQCNLTLDALFSTSSFVCSSFQWWLGWPRASLACLEPSSRSSTMQPSSQTRSVSWGESGMLTLF